MVVKGIEHKSADRFQTKYASDLQIQTYGADNLYPNQLRRIIAGSPTGLGCLRRYARFIEGNGIKDIELAEMSVNRSGETLDSVHSKISEDLATFGGYALHVNYNAFGEVCELHHIPFEMCRLKEPDDNGFVSKVYIHPDWTGKTTRKGKQVQVKLANCDVIDTYNPIQQVVLAQIEACGGAQYYKGQVLYVSGNGVNSYPTGRADGVITEMSTDEGLANVKYRNVRNNFLPSGMLITKKSQSSPEREDEYIADEFSDAVVKFQGDTEACKMLQVEIESDEDKPEFVQLNTSNYDKEYTATETSVVERIYSAYGQENFYCIRIGKVGFSGDITRDAFDVYNSEVNPEQRNIERTLTKIFKHWYMPIVGNFSIEPLIYVSNGASNSTE